MGIEEGVLNQIKNELDNQLELLMKDQCYQNESIGIKNVNNQIKLIYGKEYGLDMHSTFGKGTQSIIKMPFRSDDHV